MSDELKPAPTPMSSPVNDIRKLRKNGTATAAEFQEFLRHLRGKSPKEVLGSVASSNLFQSLITATIGVAILIAVFTVIPWGLGMIGGGDKKVVAPTPKAPTTEVADPKAETTTPSTGETPATEGTASSTIPNTVPDIDSPIASDITEKLGVGEAKDAPKDVNPLEGATDDLLKDLE